MEAIKLMLDHDEIERQGLQAITKVLLGIGGTVVYWGFLWDGEGCLWMGYYKMILYYDSPGRFGYSLKRPGVLIIVRGFDFPALGQL